MSGPTGVVHTFEGEHGKALTASKAPNMGRVVITLSALSAPIVALPDDEAIRLRDLLCAFYEHPAGPT